MSKIFYLILSFMSPFILTGCLLMDPVSWERKSGKSEIEGKVKSLETDRSYNDSYLLVRLKSKNEKLFFAQSSNLDKMLFAQIEVNDYIKYIADYDKKIKTLEITKNNEDNCKINIFVEYDQNNKQRINDFAYVINNEKDEEKCSKYSLKEPLNGVKLLRKTTYIK